GHLAGELLKLKLDPKLVHVPYKGAGPALNDVAGGQVDFYFPAAASGMPLVQGGRVKLLAVSSAKRASVVPDIPTVAEATGISNFDFTLWVGFFAPRAVPKDIVTRLHDAINKIILEPDIKKKLESPRRPRIVLRRQNAEDHRRPAAGRRRHAYARLV